MSLKTVTFSVRVSRDDAEFISRLNLDGAKTPSDKIRSIIRQARVREENAQDYNGCIYLVRELMDPVLSRLRELELDEKAHSELILRLMEWLPEVIGFIVSSLQPPKRDKQALAEFEQAVADRVFRLIESVLRMGATKQCRCYDPRAIAERIEPVLEISRVMEIARKAEKE